jgi:hypothetical protein
MPIHKFRAEKNRRFEIPFIIRAELDALHTQNFEISKSLEKTQELKKYFI